MLDIWERRTVFHIPLVVIFTGSAVKTFLWWRGSADVHVLLHTKELAAEMHIVTSYVCYREDERRSIRHNESHHLCRLILSKMSALHYLILLVLCILFEKINRNLKDNCVCKTILTSLTSLQQPKPFCNFVHIQVFIFAILLLPGLTLFSNKRGDTDVSAKYLLPMAFFFVLHAISAPENLSMIKD